MQPTLNWVPFTAVSASTPAAAALYCVELVSAS